MKISAEPYTWLKKKKRSTQDGTRKTDLTAVPPEAQQE